MKTKMKWILYSLNFLVFMAISMVNTQIIPFLGKIGYSVIERGYIIAGSAIIAIIGQFLFGYLCDRFKRIKPFFFLAYLVMTLGSVMMFLLRKQMFFYHIFAVSISGGMVKVIMGLNETWMLEIDEDNYGKLRAAGALGLTIGSPIAGYLVKAMGYAILLYMLAGVSVFLLLFLWKSQDANKQDSEHIRLTTVKELVRNYPYLLLVLIYLLIYMIGTADQYVVIDKMLSIGAKNGEVGIKWAVQSFMEVPLFLFASKILKRWKPGQLLLFGTLMYAVKFFLYGFLHQSWGIIATATLQIVTLPIIMLTSKVLIKEITPVKLCSSAQMFAMAVFIGVSGLITPIITSYLSKQIGYDWTLYATALFAIVPLLLIFWYLHIRKQQKVKGDTQHQ